MINCLDYVRDGQWFTIYNEKQFQTALSDEGVKYENWSGNAWTDFKNSWNFKSWCWQELKYLLLNNLTDDLTQARFFKGVDASYYYEG